MFNSENEFFVLSKDGCPHCVRAKNLLTRLGHSYEELDVTKPDNQAYKDYVTEYWSAKGKRPTVPLVVRLADGEPQVIGGADDLLAYFKK